MKKISALPLVLLGIMFSCTNSKTFEIAETDVRLEVGSVNEKGIRITMMPSEFDKSLLNTPILNKGFKTEPELSFSSLTEDIDQEIGDLKVAITSDPLSIEVKDANDKLIQKIRFNSDGTVEFQLKDQLVLGMGEGGPQPKRGVDWDDQNVEFNRIGRYHEMQPRWQAGIYGSRNPVPLLIGTEGWALFIHVPWGSFDLSKEDVGIFKPRIPTINPDSLQQTFENQGETLGKGIHPAEYLIPGLLDIFIFDARDPKLLMKNLAELTGKPVLPPKWALGYMQSHRTLEDDGQMVEIAQTFRDKEIPLDALIYLGTGFTPSGWNEEQPSFDVNPEVFTRPAKEVFDDIHERNAKVILHMVPWDRDKLETLRGNIPPEAGEKVDSSHILGYWKQHLDLVEAGTDAWWPDEGDWFNLFERMKRHQLYYEGPLATHANVRPWSLHRNGFLGVSKWGGWIWSGDTHSTWKSLEAQIAVGINHSLSLSPFWGTDIGGFFPTPRLTGDLYARWFQFGAFNPSFRSHGRTWWTRLPWGWGLDGRGPLESDTPPLEEAMNNPEIEPIVKKYAELRYSLLSYNYSFAWEATQSGMPMIRSLWLEYPNDDFASSIDDQFLWGDAMLIAPVFTKDATEREVYLPQGEWYDWWTNEKETGEKTVTKPVDLSIMPIYVCAGAIIPIDPIRQYVDEPVDEPLEIKVYRGDDGTFTLYEDDGISQSYLDGEYTLTNFEWNDASSTLTISSGKENGGDQEGRELIISTIPDDQTKQVNYSGGVLKVSF